VLPLRVCVKTLLIHKKEKRRKEGEMAISNYFTGNILENGHIDSNEIGYVRGLPMAIHFASGMFSS
jgi:hypothetical protein